MVAALLLLLGLGACRGHSDARRPPDDLLITLDTVRADALGVYGASPSPTPTIDALGARGVVVDEAMTVAPLTLPAHASILTGTYPTRTGIRDNMSFRLGDEAVTLAERLADIGYDTGAFVSAAVLDRAFGLGQGFHRYGDDVHAAGLLGIPRRPAGEGVTAAVSWIASLPAEKPTFTWLHLYDAHLPLTPPADALARFPGDGYTASIAYADAQVGLLLDRYRAHGRDPIVVIVADHGEGRGDHGEQTHGWFVYRSTMRVPLVMHGPGVPEGVRWAGTASVVDIVPTVLDLLGQAPPGGSRWGFAAPRAARRRASCWAGGVW